MMYSATALVGLPLITARLAQDRLSVDDDHSSKAKNLWPPGCNPHDMRNHEDYIPWAQLHFADIIVGQTYDFECTHDDWMEGTLTCDSEKGWISEASGDQSVACPPNPETADPMKPIYTVLNGLNNLYLKWTTEDEYEHQGDLYEFKCANGEQTGWMRHVGKGWQELSEQQETSGKKACPAFPPDCNPFQSHLVNHDNYKPWLKLRNNITHGNYYFFDCAHNKNEIGALTCDSEKGWIMENPLSLHACPAHSDIADPMNTGNKDMYVDWTTKDEWKHEGDLYEFQCVNGDEQPTGWMRHEGKGWQELSNEEQEASGKAPCPSHPKDCNPLTIHTVGFKDYTPWSYMENNIVHGEWYTFYCEHHFLQYGALKCDSEKGWIPVEAHVCPADPNGCNPLDMSKYPAYQSWKQDRSQDFINGENYFFDCTYPNPAEGIQKRLYGMLTCDSETGWNVEPQNACENKDGTITLLPETFKCIMLYGYMEEENENTCEDMYGTFQLCTDEITKKQGNCLVPPIKDVMG